MQNELTYIERFAILKVWYLSYVGGLLLKNIFMFVCKLCYYISLVKKDRQTYPCLKLAIFFLMQIVVVEINIFINFISLFNPNFTTRPKRIDIRIKYR